MGYSSFLFLLICKFSLYLWKTLLPCSTNHLPNCSIPKYMRSTIRNINQYSVGNTLLNRVQCLCKFLLSFYRLHHFQLLRSALFHALPSQIVSYICNTVTVLFFLQSILGCYTYIHCLCILFTYSCHCWLFSSSYSLFSLFIEYRRIMYASWS